MGGQRALVIILVGAKARVQTKVMGAFNYPTKYLVWSRVSSGKHLNLSVGIRRRLLGEGAL